MQKTKGNRIKLNPPSKINKKSNKEEKRKLMNIQRMNEKKSEERIKEN